MQNAESAASMSDEQNKNYNPAAAGAANNLRNLSQATQIQQQRPESMALPSDIVDAEVVQGNGGRFGHYLHFLIHPYPA